MQQEFVGQVPLYAESNNIIVFKSSSMNQTHHRVLDKAIAQNFVSYFTNAGEVIKPLSIIKRDEDDAQIVAQDLQILYNNL